MAVLVHVLHVLAVLEKLLNDQTVLERILPNRSYSDKAPIRSLNISSCHLLNQDMSFDIEIYQPKKLFRFTVRN